MRLLVLAALVALGGCDVANDTANDKVTVTYDKAEIRKTAEDTRRAAEKAAKSAANIANGTARVIKDEVGKVDVDVDVKVKRERAADRQ